MSNPLPSKVDQSGEVSPAPADDVSPDEVAPADDDVPPDEKVLFHARDIASTADVAVYVPLFSSVLIYQHDILGRVLPVSESPLSNTYH